MSAVIDQFYDYFTVVPANTAPLRDRVYRLRYQVYCLETAFEEPKMYPNEMEQDEYDKYSAHSLLCHRASGVDTGTVRLVLPDPVNLKRPFPIELHCGDVFDSSLMDLSALPRATLAEISRFAVSKEFKRRAGEQSTVAGVAASAYNTAIEENDERRMFPHIVLGLFHGVVQMSVEHGITDWYAVMELGLFRLLKRFGILFTPVGPVVDYHGRRLPCVANASTVLNNIRLARPEVWSVITDNGRLKVAK